MVDADIDWGNGGSINTLVYVKTNEIGLLSVKKILNFHNF